MKSETSSDVMKTLFFGLKEKELLSRGLLKTVAIYLIHEPDWTSIESFFFNPKLLQIMRRGVYNELSFKHITFKTATYSCGNPFLELFLAFL